MTLKLLDSLRPRRDAVVVAAVAAAAEAAAAVAAAAATGVTASFGKENR